MNTISFSIPDWVVISILVSLVFGAIMSVVKIILEIKVLKMKRHLEWLERRPI